MSFSARAVFRLRLSVVPLFLLTVLTLVAVGPVGNASWAGGATATLGVRN